MKKSLHLVGSENAVLSRFLKIFFSFCRNAQKVKHIIVTKAKAKGILLKQKKGIGQKPVVNAVLPKIWFFPEFLQFPGQ